MNTLRNLCRDLLLAGSLGGKKVQYIFSVLSGINSMSIPRADKAFERNLKAKMKHFCNILLLYVKHSHVS